MPLLPTRRASQRELIKIHNSLSVEQQQTLLSFAKFLSTQPPEPVKRIIPEPQAIPRPAEESVVQAMKRLSATYFMLDKAPLLNETSALMAQHLIQGRDRVEVIDELEVIFKTHYQRLVEDA